MVPKRNEVLKKIAKAAKAAGVEWVLVREGNHSLYRIGDQARLIAIGHHSEFGNRYAEMVYKELEPTLGKGWWK